MQTAIVAECPNSSSQNPTRDVCADRDRAVVVKAIPYKLTTGPLPCGMRESTYREQPDVILLNDLNAARLIEFHVSASVAAIVPVIDAAGYQQSRNNDNAQRADLRIAAASEACVDQILPRLTSMIERVRRLPEAVFSTSDRRVHLLSRLFVRGRGLTPRYDSGRCDLLDYQDASAIPNLIQHAEALADLGALDRRVFETLTACPACGSARVLTRPSSGCLGIDARRAIHCIDCDADHAAGSMVSKTIYSYHLTRDRSQIGV